MFVERSARKGGVLEKERRCFKSRTGDVLEQGGQRCLWRDPQGKAVSQSKRGLCSAKSHDRPAG